MNYKIADDARPQLRALLLLTALSVVLWFIPFADILVYPFRIFVTFIHEGGHALAALLTGNSVASLSVAPDGSGLTYSTQGGFFSQLLVSSAGYLGAISFGALMLILIRRAIPARAMLYGAAGVIAFLTVFFGLLAPFFNFMISSWSSIPFTVLAGGLIAGGLFLIARKANPYVAQFFISFLAVQCVLNALSDLKTVFFLSTPLAGYTHSDAVNLAQATGLPPMLWVLIWVAVSLIVLSVSLRVYAVNVKSKRPQQPDLPFEV